MRDPLERYYPGVNFWNVMPQLADVGAFGKLFTDDETPEKLVSSGVMWWIVRVWHLTHRNVLREEMTEVRMHDASQAIWSDPKWHTKPKKRTEQLDGLRDAWNKLKPIEQRTLETARMHFQQRDAYLQTLTYEKDRLIISKENADTPKLIAQLDALELAYRIAMGELEEEEDPNGHALEEGWFTR